MNRIQRQLNIRVPADIQDEVKELCWVRRWSQEVACLEFIKLGLLVAKNKEIHNQLNEIIKKADLVDVRDPDYVQLAIEQFRQVEKLDEIRHNLKLNPINDSWKSHAVKILTHKEIEV